MHELATLSPADLASILRPFIPIHEHPTLEALVKKATHNDRLCDLCYEHAKQEGAREAMSGDNVVLGFCPHGVNLDTDLCPQGCRV